MSDNNKKDEITNFQILGLNFPYNKTELINLTLKVWLVMATLLIVSIIFFGYEMTNADLPMGPIAGILIAYLIYILKE